MLFERISARLTSGRLESQRLLEPILVQLSAGGREVLWLERWDHDVLMGEGRTIEPISVSFLPGS
mgnify:CR=1 FL=1